MTDMLSKYKAEFEAILSPVIDSLDIINSPVGAAMKYSLTSGGKRIRPILCYMAADLMGASHDNVRAIALAVEMIHNYSLVHDDLEVMDNDALRHGMAATHILYGEATGVLCGDGLLNLAFETLLTDIGTANKQHASLYIAQKSGALGMVGGQSIDLENEGKDISLELICELNSKKTAALFKAALVGSAIACGASDVQISVLERYCEHIGLIFQLVDDILDITSDATVLGKSVGKDIDARKSTYLACVGIEATKSEIARLYNECVKELSIYGASADNLVKLAQYLINREY